MQEFAAEYHRELNRVSAAREQAYAVQREELASVERRLRKIVDAIADGVPARTLNDELLALETRQEDDGSP